MQLRIHHEAGAELLDAAAYYALEAGTDQARAFRNDFENSTARILEFPGSGTPVWKKVRRTLFSSFPYAIFYFQRIDELWVVSVCHQARRPGYWKDRLKDV